jgi:hypothetical protein
MLLKDFIAKQAIQVIVGTVLDPTTAKIPVSIDPKAFYRAFSDKIDADTLTDEKALYVASREPVAPMVTARDMLNSQLRFN